MKVVATEIGLKIETPKLLKRIPLLFSVDPNPRDSVLMMINYSTIARPKCREGNSLQNVTATFYCSPSLRPLTTGSKH